MAKAKTKNVLFGVQKQQLKHLSTKEYLALRELSGLSKNMYNVALFNVRQYFFAEKKYLSYQNNYHLCKFNENYALLNSNSAQQILKVVDRGFQSFFALIKKAKLGSYPFQNINLPHYLKKEAYFNLIFSEFNCDGEFFQVPMSPAFRKTFGKVVIKIPPNLNGKNIKEVRILPKNDAKYFEIQYIYEYAEVQSELDNKKALAIDVGLNNLATCATNEGKSFIIDGKRLKSINQWFNKENARLQSIKDKQKVTKLTKRQEKLWNKRRNVVTDYIHKSARIIVNYCLEHKIGNLVIGYNPTLQQECNLGRRTNQNFVNIPIGQLHENLAYLCERYRIKFIEQEESYTSKASFLDNDAIPVYNAFSKENYEFSGKRIKRGLYRSKEGILLNADINGALNILRKSSLNEVKLEQSRGGLDTPKRIRIV